MSAVRPLAVGIVAALSFACDDYCIRACDDRFDECVASGRLHEECHAALQECEARCPPPDYELPE
jgi:hypothetical protein